MTYDDLVKESRTFFRNNRGCKIRTSENMIENLKTYSETIEKFANHAYPVIHETVLDLIHNFIMFKRAHGSKIEKKLYESMTLVEFLDRLISKRPLAFLTAADSWLLKNGHFGAGGWEEIGTDKEGSTYESLTLEDFLSYDEVKIAALLQLSSPSVTINDGSRHNVGRKGEDGSYVDAGVYVGAVGARFEMEGRMEYQDMLVTPQQNTEAAGYGLNNSRESVLKVFAKFYNMENFHSYEEAKNSKDMYKGIDFSQDLLNKEIYTKRIQISAETFLIESEQRGISENKDIYCHVVGLGLGVWQISRDQNKYFLKAWVQAIKELKISKVKDIDFSWIAKNGEVGQLEDGKQFQGVNIHFSRRNPFDPLPPKDQDKLIVAMFAWDGNSYVGNEYWNGHLSASGDPAAASCSTIPELLNPDINWRNIRGSNVKIASREKGLVSINQFIKA